MSDDELRKLWTDAGGSFHGPHIETGAMPESQLLPFLRNLAVPASAAVRVCPISDIECRAAVCESVVGRCRKLDAPTPSPISQAAGELLPCAFCGGKAIITGKQVGCGNEWCSVDAAFVKADTLARSIECWNTRPGSKVLQWKLVPVEPTNAMIDAACPVGETVDHFDMGTALREAIKAAPISTAPTTGSAPSRQMLTQAEIASCILPGHANPASPAASVLTAINDVLAERKRQDAQWGGPEHDDQHRAFDWTGYMGYQAQQMHRSPNDTRERFVKIAAIAVAAIESIDRKNVALLAASMGGDRK